MKAVFTGILQKNYCGNSQGNRFVESNSVRATSRRFEKWNLKWNQH